MGALKAKFFYDSKLKDCDKPFESFSQIPARENTAVLVKLNTFLQTRVFKHCS